MVTLSARRSPGHQYTGVPTLSSLGLSLSLLGFQNPGPGECVGPARAEQSGQQRALGPHPTRSLPWGFRH